MKVVIAGGSGFIGRALVERLLGAGHDVAVLTRHPGKVRHGRPLQWDGASQGTWSAEAASADTVINLAGEDIGKRWTEERKRRLTDSRIIPTRALVEAMRSAGQRQRLFISVSATGYYGLRGDEVLDENASAGSGFLAELTQKWEGEARRAEAAARTVILRCGVVIDRGGGALAKMLLPFRLGLGGRIGTGRQWLSWVARPDAVRMFEWVMGRSDVAGVYNNTSPNPVRNREFTAALGRVLKRPAFIPVPPFALRLLYGEMADQALLGGQRVVPARAKGDSFSFELETIEPALHHALKPRR